MAEITGFDDEIRTADLLVTGEGRTDEQTAHGKLCAVLAAKARAAGAKTILISGALHGDLGEVNDLFDAVFAAVQDVCSLEEALEHGGRIWRPRQEAWAGFWRWQSVHGRFD